MDGTKTTTNWIIAGIVALVVIIGGGWLIARERSGAMAGDVATDTASSTTTGAEAETASAAEATESVTTMPIAKPAPSPMNATASASGENVTVVDQPAGNTVTIAEANIKKPSWIAVRDTRGWYPGAKLIAASDKNITIPLLRNTEAGKTYEVVIFLDNGDKKFSIHGGDMLVTSTQGAPVSSTFTAK